MRAFLTVLVFILLAVACMWHKSSAGFIFGILFLLFAGVTWLARPRKGRDHEI